VDDAEALTFLSRTKDVSIDGDWRVTGRYTCEFEISHPEDVREIHHIIRQFKKNTGPSSKIFTEVRLPDGTTPSWNNEGENHLPSGTSVRLSAAIERNFPGFAELFADSMNIHQDAPVKTASYRITFPTQMNFICQIAQDSGFRQETSYGNCFAWSGEDITRLDIMVSTATSWEQIENRYQAHFQSRLGGGLSITDIPKSLRDINRNGPSGEKIQAVMNFLKTDLAYRASLTPAHALLPDDPATVLHRGWGDCKDLALLGTALLQKMDVHAFVVLTGTPRAHWKDEAIPDPFIFDHALIGISENGRPLYYDCLGPNGTVTPNDRQVYLPLEVSCNAPQ
jgi:hypothetical protein